MNKINILITDDNREFCQLFAEFLEGDADFNVIDMFYNGEEVLEYIKENENPDILILDLIMPHLDGIGVLEELNAQDLIGDMKIIALTAMGHDTIMKTVIELGVHYYIMKPFDLDKLKDRIKLLAAQDYKKQNNIHLNQAQLEFEKGNYTPLITDVIEELGIPAHIKGYRYVREAVELVINDMDLLSAVTKQLYPQVSKEFDSTPSRVERAIRHAIDVVWQRGNQKALKKYFSNNMNEDIKPTNSQFIAKIADTIMVELKVS
ncbi:sporulation transcription factor Spo0A [Halanaerobium praevalens]|uniref:Stage 0 sporulation protein A homolog n=1 Tax=Halanaerobium praevalens (strain ATCC 33744 / DSM 2228 / GSL) TaxID=572479 RepID=E3DRL3_HALPG|nr:sporulation transcription factor Spo0A [Halanaerobium praevalens]ADO77054.1 response regulator receiver protein [Halanaerobium praevalens DSM 2228]